MTYSIEKHIRIYDDKDGSYIEVKPDSDSLGLIEINSMVYIGTTKKREAGLIVTVEAAKLLIKALEQVLTDNPNIDVLTK